MCDEIQEFYVKNALWFRTEDAFLNIEGLNEKAYLEVILRK